MAGYKKGSNPEDYETGYLLQVFLMCSYAYYICHRSLINDHEFDRIAKILLERWNEFEHQHKHLVTEGDLRAGTAFTLRRDDYPGMVKGGAHIWMEETEVGKYAGD